MNLSVVFDDLLADWVLHTYGFGFCSPFILAIPVFRLTTLRYDIVTTVITTSVTTNEFEFRLLYMYFLMYTSLLLSIFGLPSCYVSPNVMSSAVSCSSSANHDSYIQSMDISGARHRLLHGTGQL